MNPKRRRRRGSAVMTNARRPARLLTRHKTCIPSGPMQQMYAACEIGAESGRVMLGILEGDSISLSEVYGFQVESLGERNSGAWNIPELYQHLLEGLRAIGGCQEPVSSVSCTAHGSDYVLFDREDHSALAPAKRHSDPSAEEGGPRSMAALAQTDWFEITGVQASRSSCLAHLAAEPPKRLKRTFFLPLADAFHYLLSGVARLERSAAARTHLYDLARGCWSEQIIASLRLPPSIFPMLADSGGDLGALRDPEGRLGLEDARVVAACSHELSSALMGLPVDSVGNWAFLRTGGEAILGTVLDHPRLTPEARASQYNHQPACAGGFCFYKHLPGLRLLTECQHSWTRAGAGLDAEVLMHLAGSAAPFESLIDPTDARFHEPGDLPAAIKSFCRDTGQPVPRKPGAIFRCVLESLAVLYRRELDELERLTGRRFGAVYLLDGGSNSILNHFLGNALDTPLIAASPNAVGLGSVVIQALAAGHLRSRAHAAEILRHSVKRRELRPRAEAWRCALQKAEALYAR